MKAFFIATGLITGLFLWSAWGFHAHTRINYLAVLTLPQPMLRFYKANIRYLAEHAPDPDKRRYADPKEAPRHYLDVESYPVPLDSIPRSWKIAVIQFGEATLQQNGILPWHIQHRYLQLVDAFSRRDSIAILRISANLAHYIADAHVPLHTTHNHNGQLTGQTGIHALWESLVPELFMQEYQLLTGPASYVPSILQEAWKMTSHSHSLVAQVLQQEKDLTSSYPAYRKYSYTKRKGILTRNYSPGFAREYHRRMDGMVAQQMRNAIAQTGNFWYSAWVDGGQPRLENLHIK